MSRRAGATLSPAGAAFIGAFEGFSPTCYDDGGRPGVGHCTIGYGHLVHYGPTTAADRRRWGAISRAQAAGLLRRDAHAALLGVQRHVRVRLSQHELDGLVSFAYNCGADALAGRVGRTVNARPALRRVGILPRVRRWRAELAAALVAWDHAGGHELPGLRRRRMAEWVLVTQGRYTRRAGNWYANA